jgi:hypothetical protein
MSSAAISRCHPCDALRWHRTSEIETTQVVRISVTARALVIALVAVEYAMTAFTDVRGGDAGFNAGGANALEVPWVTVGHGVFVALPGAKRMPRKGVPAANGRSGEQDVLIALHYDCHNRTARLRITILTTRY